MTDSDSPSVSLGPGEGSQLREFLAKRFSSGELKNLAFDLSVDYESFPHHTNEDFSRELISYFERRGNLSSLLEGILKKRESKFVADLLAQIKSPRGSFPSDSIIHAEGSQGFVNQPTGPLTQHFGAAPTVYNGPVHQIYNQPKGDVNVSGDTFNMSGNFQGSILNIKNTLSHTVQSIGALPNTQPSDKEQLTALITQLNEILQQVPSDKSAEAQKVAKRADELVIEVTAKELDAEVVESKGNLLLKAAENIGGALPAVLPVVQQIIAFIGKLF
jgi:hypothetical protein